MDALLCLREVTLFTFVSVFARRITCTKASFIKIIKNTSRNKSRNLDRNQIMQSCVEDKWCHLLMQINATKSFKFYDPQEHTGNWPEYPSDAERPYSCETTVFK